ncbi:MAG: DUF4198 domain-containing protein [Sphingomicrobium sp.]
MPSAKWLALCVALATPATAHDFWLNPQRFWVAPGASLPATLLVGHGQFRQRSPIPQERIHELRTLGPGGVIDQLGGLHMAQGPEDLQLSLKTPGTQVAALSTNFSATNLPSIRFNDYLQAEGLTPAIQWRARTGTADSPGRELYSRRAKALIQVGPPAAASSGVITRPIGLTLEIVPDKNPYLLKLPARLPVRIFYHSRPLAGALVKLTDLAADDKPVEMHRSDSSGRVAFTIPKRGNWLINVIWTRPTPRSNAADFETTFSSLSFGYP